MAAVPPRLVGMGTTGNAPHRGVAHSRWFGRTGLDGVRGFHEGALPRLGEPGDHARIDPAGLTASFSGKEFPAMGSRQSAPGGAISLIQASMRFISQSGVGRGLPTRCSNSFLKAN